jgi:hypothetical protein
VETNEGQQYDCCSLNVVDRYHVVFDYTLYNDLREDKRFSMIFLKGKERKNMIAFTTQ